MLKSHLTRRELVKEAAKYGILFCGAGHAVASFASINRLFGGSKNSGYLDELIKKAPKARFWVSAGKKGVDCAHCHDALAAGANQNEHQERYIKCLLCAQGCLIEEGER